MIKSLISRIKKILIAEGGQVLPLVLVMLVVGSTIVVGSLTYAATTISIGHESLNAQEQYYAAEAGAKDAVWRYKYDYFTTIANVGLNEWVYKPSPVNNQNMEVTASYVSKGLSKIVSEAYKDGYSTTVEYYLSGVSVFFNNTAVAYGTINTFNKPFEDILFPVKYKENYHNFPTAAFLLDYYTDRNPPLTTSSNVQINTTGNPSIGNTNYQNGISITGTGTVTLTGNIVVNGNIDFTNSTWTIDMNGYTIFATGALTQAKQKGYFNGPGCIIAVGDIGLWPQAQAGYEDKYVFIMSVSGSVTLKPKGDFYGSVAAGSGGVSLEMQPGTKVTHTTLPLGGLDFPDDPSTYEWSVSNWKSKREPILFIITKVLPPAEVDLPYSHTLVAKNGIPPYVWAVTSGSLPDGLVINAVAPGEISGIPTTPTAEPHPKFTVQVTDSAGDTSTQELTIAVYPRVVIPAQAPADGQVGVEYLYELDVDGGLEPYTWSIQSESFPALSDWADPAELSQGIIHGTPTTAGTYTFTINVTDGLGAEPFFTIELSILINPP